MEVTEIKALGFDEPGKDASAATLLTLKKPELGPRDILVRVHAVSINPVDCKKRMGFFHVKGEPIVLGYDACGQVEAVGSEAKHFKHGDEVYYAGDIKRQGTNAEYHVVDERIVALKPKSLNPCYAASFPLVGLTAWEGLFEQLRIPLDRKKNEGKSILILGGAGGVGSLTIQLAKKLAGLRVIASASRAETIKYCEKMGADAVINHHHHINEEFLKIGVKGVDYVYSTNEITKKRFDEIIDHLNPFGKLVTILPFHDHLDLCKLKNKGISISFECMFTRPAFGIEMEKQGEILRNLANLVDDGTILDITTKVLSFSPESLISAHAVAESGTNIGKLTLDKVHEFFHFAKH